MIASAGAVAGAVGVASPAFTLVELLVVIAVIGILAALLLSALATAKERALRIKCLSNVKQVDLCFIEYAHDNNERLPYDQWVTQNPPWVSYITEPSFDKFNPVGPVLRNYGLKPGFLTCPANLNQNNPTWLDPSAAANLYAGGMPYVIGLSNNNIALTNRNEMVAQQLILVKAGSPGGVGTVYALTDLSRRVLVADNSLTGYTNNNDPALWQTYDWTTLNRLDPSPAWGSLGPQDYLRADHIDSRKKVTGGNDGMLDGHAQWVRAKDLRPCGPDYPPGYASHTWTWWW